MPALLVSSNAWIPVRATGEPRSDGSMLVYLPDGTGLVVNSQYVTRLGCLTDSTGTETCEGGPVSQPFDKEQIP